MMREACVKAVEDAIGRELGAGEARGIETRIRKWQRLLARRGAEDWQKLSGTQRLAKAAEAAAKELMAEIGKERQRLSLSIAAWDRNENLLQTFDAADWNGRLQAIGRLAAFDASKGGVRSIDSRARAMADMMRGQLLAAFKLASPKIFGLFDNPAGVRDLIREIYGENSGNPTARLAAQAWRKVMAEARDRLNAAGGHVGTLGETYFPNHHSKWKVAEANFDAWYSFIQPLLDRGKYLEADGSHMAPERLQDFFHHVFNTIITDGDSKAIKTPGQPDMIGPEGISQRPHGYGLFADRHSQHRQVFFKDAASFINYQAKFGEHSFVSTILGHVNRMARDTAVLESQGPWADQTFRAINDREALAARLANPDRKSQDKITSLHDLNERMWRMATGERDIVDSKVAGRFVAFRNILTGLRLGKVVFTALGDEAGMAATATANRVPYSEMLANEIKLLNPLDRAHRDSVESLGVGLNSMLGSLNRYADENFGAGLSGKFANFVLRVTGAERMWDTRRQSVYLSTMHAIGKLSRTTKHVTDLNEADHGMLTRKGVTDTEWQVWRRAGLNADGAITPHEIWAIPDDKLKDLGDPMTLKRNASTTMMAHAAEEASLGVMETGIRERARMERFLGSPDQNTGVGQIVRSALLFKTFAATMMMKHWSRAASLNTLGSRLTYGAILTVYGTAIAATINAFVRPFITGQNPRDLRQKRFWIEAMLRGGGAGYFGDFLYEELNSRGDNLGSALLGPVGTTANEVWNLTGGAAFKASRGERTDEAGNLIRFGKDNLPLTNLWYTSALFDHMVTYQLQESLNPGYLDRMMDRQEKMGKTWYWDPHDFLPSEAPQLSKAVGE